MEVPEECPEECSTSTRLTCNEWNEKRSVQQEVARNEENDEPAGNGEAAFASAETAESTGEHAGNGEPEIAAVGNVNVEPAVLVAVEVEEVEIAALGNVESEPVELVVVEMEGVGTAEKKAGISTVAGPCQSLVVTSTLNWA